MSTTFEDRAYRRENHLCTNCGEKLPDGYKYRRCDFCKAMFREKRSVLKRGGFCVRCKKQDAFTISGRNLCAECAEKHKAECKNWYYSDGVKDKASNRALSRYYLLKGSNRCITCGKTLPVRHRFHKCTECRNHQLVYQQEVRRKRGILSRSLVDYLGLCYICMKNPVFENHKVCEKCYGILCDRIAKARLNIDLKNHIFRKLNNAHYEEMRRKYGEKNTNSNKEQDEG